MNVEFLLLAPGRTVRFSPLYTDEMIFLTHGLPAFQLSDDSAKCKTKEQRSN